MSRRATLVILCAILLWQALGLFSEVAAQAQDRLEKTDSFWTQSWDWLREHTFLFSILIVTSITVFSTVMAMLKKDKILKTLAGHLVTIELKGTQPDHDGTRHRGRLRVESDGLEVVAEKANKSNEKVSFLLHKADVDGIHALVRYHDFLTDREKEEREAEVGQVYHPSIDMRLRRKARNIVNEMRRVATEAFTLVFGKVKAQFSTYGTEIEKAGQEAVGFVTTATYDTLIDRLIGTRVVVYIKEKLEYVGVLKDYTSQFIELLNVNYKNSWQVTLERTKGYSKTERGLTLETDGNDIVIRSRSPFKVTLRHIYWKEESPDAKRENINKTIEPFGELRLSLVPALDMIVQPFDKLQLPTHLPFQKYKKILLNFESVRVADVVLLKNYGIVKHRTEKYEAKILDFGALADVLLTNRGENLVLEGDPSVTPLTIYNGYLTNLPRERLHVEEVDAQCNLRWTADGFFTMLDKRLRPVSSHRLLGLLPLRRSKKVMALFTLIEVIHSDEKRKKDPLLPLIYLSLCTASSKKRPKSHMDHVLTRKRRRLVRFRPRPSRV